MTGVSARDCRGKTLEDASVETKVGASSDPAQQSRDRRTEEAQSSPEYISFGCYHMTDKGLFMKSNSDEQDPKSSFICGSFEILGRARDSNGEGWARLLRWSDDDHRVHTLFVSDADLHGDPSALCAKLASRGLKVATERAARTHLISYLNQTSVEDRVTIVERTGWQEVNTSKVFVLQAGNHWSCRE